MSEGGHQNRLAPSMTERPDPHDPIDQLRGRMDRLRLDLRRAVDEPDDPQAKALLEVSAEVVGGLIKAFDDYREKSEPAWRQLAKRIFP